MSFSKIMAAIAVLTRDRSTDQAIRYALAADHALVCLASWSRLEWMVRERPVTVTIIDGLALPRRNPAGAMLSILERYPSVATVLVAREEMDRALLFRLGRAGLAGLVLLELDGLVRELPRAVRRSLRESTDSVVTRVVSPSLPRREATAIRMAVEGVQRGWRTDDVASAMGLTRAHLSVRLRTWGLPPTGHLVTWARLFHAGRWILDPGRTAESVSRQLDYSSGAAFRRVLRSYVGVTPTELRSAGGLRPVLESFLEACDLDVHPRAVRSVA